jgi:hypothetical protein
VTKATVYVKSMHLQASSSPGKFYQATRPVLLLEIPSTTRQHVLPFGQDAAFTLGKKGTTAATVPD